MRRISILTVSALALVAGACSSAPQPANKANVEKSIRDVEASMNKALSAKDAAAFAANYATDAVVMTPGMGAMKGRDAIREGITALLADPNVNLAFRADRTEVADSGDMVATRGSYTLTATDPLKKKPMTDKGSYVTVFRKQTDGAWKAVLDINASEVPPPAPPAPKVVARKKGKRKR
jgi:uncharacterized protein (TIGR02246 family)